MTRLDGIIIRTYPSSEADLMLRIISRSEGKVSLLAKHARKSTRRFAGGLDMFDRGTFESSKGRGSVPVLTSFSPSKPFRGLREDLDKLTLSSLICECFDYLVQEDATGAMVLYETLERGLEELASSTGRRESLRLTHSVISKLLEVTGFMAGQGNEQPTARSLLSLLSRVEVCAERKLACRDALNDLLATFQREVHD